ncbi:pyridoxal phosphate-dependent aminotransferase [Pseudomonas tremae]|uniref:pyridoxal phosphate-dependent aminotransferase n=1 Tax=Pseudomonas tremae TaxID=200454 RepID=UPI001F356FD8|nr:aminotransferase class I/II-fold pyridoxal phosphate-dependent enzyme [Pseudomonas tremae]MCF5747996.1 aminotransferase class I/II-fold pyridoxal phosphate-dependent enzyme [Pseudomonas tremae]UQB36465.1 histidinol-phosphate aminotransferase family protein [Pseudomonas tremae]
MIDLTWTGNVLIDIEQHNNRIATLAGRIDFSKKGSSDSSNVKVSLANYYDIPVEYVEVGAGATQLIELLLRGNYKSKILDVVPNFHLVRTVSMQEGFDYTPLTVGCDDDVLSMLKKIDADNECILSLSSPRNPLGYSWTIEELREIVEYFPGLVLIDQVYAEFDDDSIIPLVHNYPNLVIVRTFSKAWGMANMRIGYAISSGFSNGIRLTVLPNSVNGLAQNTAIMLLEQNDLVADSLKVNKENRTYLEGKLSQVDGLNLRPSQANFICFESDKSDLWFESLLKVGIMVRKLHDLKDYPLHWRKGLRITVPNRAACKVIVEVITAGKVA